MDTNETTVTPSGQSEKPDIDAIINRLAADNGMTVEQLAELTPEQLEEVAGGTDWLQTLIDQWKELKHGIVDGFNSL
jgi:hypothetical protein